MSKAKVLIAGVLVTAMFMAGCSNNTSEGESLSGSQTVSDTVEEVKPLVTEEDYRNAIAGESDNAKKLEIYREFAAGYKLKEDEYLDYAALCGEAGDTAAQRDVLFTLYRMDPTEEHGEMLSEVTVKLTPNDDAEAGELLKKLVDVLKNCEGEDFDPEAVKEIILSDEWKKSFYIDNGTFTSNTEYEGSTVSSDTLSTRAVITEGDMRYLCEVNYDGVNVGRVEAKDGASSGKYYYRQLDDENVDIISVNGYINEGHYVNQADFTVGSTVYHGSFDDAGHTKEEQPEGFEGVVYAYTDDKTNYLYVENADASDWVADVSDMGFGEF